MHEQNSDDGPVTMQHVTGQHSPNSTNKKTKQNKTWQKRSQRVKLLKNHIISRSIKKQKSPHGAHNYTIAQIQAQMYKIKTQTIDTEYYHASFLL